jgi:hypothetical protein
MAEDNRLPVRFTPAPLPDTRLPITPSTWTSALGAHLRLKASEVLHRRMNSIADERLQLERTLTSLTEATIARQRALAEWDDIGNILADDQAVRNNARELGGIQRTHALDMAKARAGNELLEAEIKKKRLLRELGRANADTNTKSDLEARLDQMKQDRLIIERHIAKAKLEIDDDDTIAPVDKATVKAEVEAQIRHMAAEIKGRAVAQGDEGFDQVG